ncbi:hypothetical protein DPMN_113751 [Dreissena polymorpha]|uniref:Uncharacterized protein n=1 Tax=Dreissena polymorpha TaxID=45954 RepID=A0A9D4KIW3_DREPO|nr:hypothetical protein DPMN_113751 [Dreissena polymorpha]
MERKGFKIRENKPLGPTTLCATKASAEVTIHRIEEARTPGHTVQWTQCTSVESDGGQNFRT